MSTPGCPRRALCCPSPPERHSSEGPSPGSCPPQASLPSRRPCIPTGAHGRAVTDLHTGLSPRLCPRLPRHGPRGGTYKGPVSEGRNEWMDEGERSFYCPDTHPHRGPGQHHSSPLNPSFLDRELGWVPSAVSRARYIPGGCTVFPKWACGSPTLLLPQSYRRGGGLSSPHVADGRAGK